MKILGLGAGAYGTALGEILVKNGYKVAYYDKRFGEQSLEDMTVGAQMILLCVPSNVVPEILPRLPHTTPLIVATKGILEDEVFAVFEDYMVISGPGFADDIKAEKKTKLTVTDDRLRQMFKADYMDFDQTDDKRGVLMCGALKNVYALQAGYEALERDSLEWKKFIAEATKEMKEILVLNGARAETVDLACGIGDLELTCGLPSRNYEYGNLLKQKPGYKSEKTVEGLSTLEQIVRGKIVVPSTTPILHTLIDRKELEWD